MVFGISSGAVFVSELVFYLAGKRWRYFAACADSIF